MLTEISMTNIIGFLLLNYWPFLTKISHLMFEHSYIFHIISFIINLITGFCEAFSYWIISVHVSFCKPSTNPLPCIPLSPIVFNRVALIKNNMYYNCIYGIHFLTYRYQLFSAFIETKYITQHFVAFGNIFICRIILDCYATNSDGFLSCDPLEIWSWLYVHICVFVCVMYKTHP